LPYTQYSLVARSEALRKRFVERCSWENATPPLKDPNRVPDPSTLRRWFHNLDSSRPAFSFLRPVLQTLAQWLARGEQHAFLRISTVSRSPAPAETLRQLINGGLGSDVMGPYKIVDNSLKPQEKTSCSAEVRLRQRRRIYKSAKTASSRL
jgi:hypothetical protein